MLAAATVLACVAYLVPLAALALLLRRESDDALDLGCALAVLFAADFLGTFALTWLVPADRAAWGRTILLAALAVGIVARRALRGERIVRARGALRREDLAALALAALAGFLISYAVSSQYWVYDREWHVPFTSGLRAQRMPFRNVYEPAKTIRYHLSGDLFAAYLQSLSLATMNASRALSIAHDLQSAFLVGITALLLRWASPWSPLVVAGAALIPFLAGPIGIRAGSMGHFEGFSDFSNFTLSFRPHCMVALVVLAGIVAQLARLGRLTEKGRPVAWTRLGGLLPLFGLCSITDEISGTIVGVALAILWLRAPGLFGTRRRAGGLLLATLAGVALVANYLLAGTLAPGGPVEHAHWVAPRLPHFSKPPVRLGLDPEVWSQFWVDLAPILLPTGVLLYFVKGKRGGSDGDRDGLTPVAWLAILVTPLCLLLFLCFEVNGRVYEGHRFLTAARIIVPLVALLHAPKLARASFASVVLLAPIYAGAVISAGYAFTRMPAWDDAMGHAAYAANCRADFGARLGEPMLPTYVDEPIWYPYAGCRPIFAAGHDGPPGVVLAGWPKLGPGGFAKMDREYFPPGAPARVVCAQPPAKLTTICARARAAVGCEPEGNAALACAIAPAGRGALARP